MVAASPAQAQSPTPTPTPTPPPLPNSELSATAGLADLGSNFLERLGDQSTGGFGRAWRSNPGGGGASEAADGPLYRAWAEAYGISTKTGPPHDFVGERRQTSGGGAGIGARISSGVNVGFSVDQSRTDIDVPLAMQSATRDLSSVTVSSAFQSITVQGIGESRYGADTGASASVSLSNMVRVYLNYDGKFRAALQSHQGTAGLELRW